MKLHEIVGHNPGTGQLDFESIKVKIVFVNKCVQKLTSKVATKSNCSLFSSLNNIIMAVELTVSKIGNRQRSKRIRSHNEICTLGLGLRTAYMPIL